MWLKAKSRPKQRRYTVNNKDKPKQGELLFIMAHETTRQQLIALYGKMYDDIKDFGGKADRTMSNNKNS